MNPLLKWLSGGDLRSDGMANQAVEFILQNPDLAGDLLAGLQVSDDVVRGRAADALEKVARERPDLLRDHLDELLTAARQDPLPMARWHLAMLLGHLSVYADVITEAAPVLLELLDDTSAFVQSWAIVSLCIIARKYPAWREQVLKRVSRLQTHPSIAIRSRVRKALNLLANEKAAFPRGWIKSQHL